MDKSGLQTGLFFPCFLYIKLNSAISTASEKKPFYCRHANANSISINQTRLKLATSHSFSSYFYGENNLVQKPKSKQSFTLQAIRFQQRDPSVSSASTIKTNYIFSHFRKYNTRHDQEWEVLCCKRTVGILPYPVTSEATQDSITQTISFFFLFFDGRVQNLHLPTTESVIYVPVRDHKKEQNKVHSQLTLNIMYNQMI